MPGKSLSLFNDYDVIWLVQAAHPMSYELRGKITRRKKGAVPDSQLRPIRGYPLGKDIAVGVIEAHAKQKGKLHEFVVDEYGTISDPVSFEPTQRSLTLRITNPLTP